MTDFNPYQAPQADLITHNDKNNGIRRIGKKTLFVPAGADLPNRCIKCNQPSINFVKKTFVSNGYIPLMVFIIGTFILVAFNLVQLFTVLLFGVIITSFLTQKKQKLNMGLCEHHHKKRWLLGTVFFLTFIGCFFLFIINIRNHEALAGFCVFIGVPLSVIATGFSLFIGRAIRVDDEGVSLRGLGKPFLQSFDY